MAADPDTRAIADAKLQHGQRHLSHQPHDHECPPDGPKAQTRRRCNGPPAADTWASAVLRWTVPAPKGLADGNRRIHDNCQQRHDAVQSRDETDSGIAPQGDADLLSLQTTQRHPCWHCSCDLSPAFQLTRASLAHPALHVSRASDDLGRLRPLGKSVPSTGRSSASASVAHRPSSSSPLPTALPRTPPTLTAAPACRARTLDGLLGGLEAETDRLVEAESALAGGLAEGLVVAARDRGRGAGDE